MHCLNIYIQNLFIGHTQLPLVIFPPCCFPQQQRECAFMHFPRIIFFLLDPIKCKEIQQTYGNAATDVDNRLRHKACVALENVVSLFFLQIGIYMCVYNKFLVFRHSNRCSFYVIFFIFTLEWILIMLYRCLQLWYPNNIKLISAIHDVFVHGRIAQTLDEK